MNIWLATGEPYMMLQTETPTYKVTEPSEPEADMSKVAVAARLKVAREALKYKSQRKFAREAGIKPSAYNQYEKAVNRPELEAAVLLCERYKLTLDYIYRGELSNIPGPVWEAAKRKL